MDNTNNEKSAEVKEVNGSCISCGYYDMLFHKCNLPSFHSATCYCSTTMTYYNHTGSYHMAYR